MNTDHLEDWLSPLYNCAREHQQSGTVTGLWYAAREYYFLGTYMDSPRRLDECCRELQAGFDDTVGKALEAADYYTSVKSNMELDQFAQTGIEGYAKAAAEALERKRRLAASEQKKQRRKHHILAGCAAAVVIILLCSAFYVFGYLQPALREQAAQLEAGEDYEGALAVYIRLLAGPWSKQADEKMKQMKERIGSRQLDEGQFEEAIALFQELDDEENVLKARTALGVSLREKGQFEEALAQFDQTGDGEQKYITYFAWADMLEEEERYQEAIEVMDLLHKDSEAVLSGEEAYQDRLARLKERRCDAAVAAVTGSVTGGSVDTALAYSLGAALDDIDGQLKFCTALDEAGADLDLVYPEGVEVSGVSLAQYQPFGDEIAVSDFLEGIKEETAIKALVFARKQRAPVAGDYLENSISDMMAQKKREPEDDDYEVRFLPGKWQELSKQKRASSLEECNLFLLSDCIYYKDGFVTIKTKYEVGTGSTRTRGYTTQYYPVFDAIDNVTVYRKDRPGQFIQIASKMRRPEEFPMPSVFTSVVSADGSMNEIVWDRFLGKSDPEFLEQALEKGIRFVG